MPLPDRETLRGQRLAWRHAPLVAHDPRAAWDGLLANRGLKETDAFFTPRLADLPDPFGMRDMERAADRLTRAIRAGERIHVFGDFDCDGVCGTAILVEALSAAGAQVSSSIPHRVDDGHGIGVAAVREAAAAGVRIGLSVDTGTACFDACETARQAGMDLIVTDHHLPDAAGLPPAFALLNPAREDCGFADRLLCGTGVAFFLLMAVWKTLAGQGRRPDYDLRRLLDRVAVATVADVMELRGVNRILVAHGLARLNEQPAPGMAALLRLGHGRGPVTVETIGFQLAPRINAAGRMAHGDEALKLLLARNGEEAEALAAILDAANRERRQVEAQVSREAEARLAGASVLAAYDACWHPGVVGLAAGRLARKYGRPAAVGFEAADGSVRVSLRGRPGFHVGRLLDACGAHLSGYGGHAGAGGGTVRAGCWEAFVADFGAAVAAQSREISAPVCAVDGVLELPALHPGLAARLARFEPTGCGNPACRWLLAPAVVTARRELRGGVVRLDVEQAGVCMRAVVFQAGWAGDVQPGCKVHLIGRLETDDWRGNGAVQFVVEDALLAE